MNIIYRFTSYATVAASGFVLMIDSQIAIFMLLFAIVIWQFQLRKVD